MVNYDSFDEILHAQRGRMVAELPKGAEVFCSAGCSGSWYFDWIAENYGPVSKHIGVELYSPCPDDLPDNVEWISNSVGDMKDVANSSVDLLFSGQNIEHLYIDDIRGFFTEAARIVKDGGYLCIDSPNRAITVPHGYTQPEHVLELTVGEVRSMMEAAGFDVEYVRGIWNCIDRDGKRLPVTELEGDVPWRVGSAYDRPEDSFIWWVVARKSRTPEPELFSVIDRIFYRQFPAFVHPRNHVGVGQLKQIMGTEAIIACNPEQPGYVFYGPYVPLAPGRYQAEFLVRFEGSAAAIRCDIVCNSGRRTLAEIRQKPKLIGQWQSVILTFDLEEYTTGVEARVVSEGAQASFRLGAQILPC